VGQPWEFCAKNALLATVVVGCNRRMKILVKVHRRDGRMDEMQGYRTHQTPSLSDGKRRLLTGLAALVLLGGGLTTMTPRGVHAEGANGADICTQGHVWREAAPTDHVCATPSEQEPAASDNSQAGAHKAASISPLTASIPNAPTPDVQVSTSVLTHICAVVGCGVSPVASQSCAVNPIACPVPAPVTVDSGSCTAPSGSLLFSMCTAQTTAALQPGGTVLATINGGGLQYIRITDATSIAGCESGPFPTKDSKRGGSQSITWTCPSEQAIPSGTRVSVGVQQSGFSVAPTMSVTLTQPAGNNANAAQPAG
jgi:hypothetical protein